MAVARTQRLRCTRRWQPPAKLKERMQTVRFRHKEGERVWHAEHGHGTVDQQPNLDQAMKCFHRAVDCGFDAARKGLERVRIPTTICPPSGAIAATSSSEIELSVATTVVTPRPSAAFSASKTRSY